MISEIDSSKAQGAFLNQQQVAEFIGISVRSVRNFEARGLIPRIKLGRRSLYRRAAVENALAKLEAGGHKS